MLYSKEDFKLHDSPSESDEGLPGQAAHRVLSAVLPKTRFPVGWVSAIVKASGEFGTKYRSAYEWYSNSPDAALRLLPVKDVKRTYTLCLT